MIQQAILIVTLSLNGGTATITEPFYGSKTTSQNMDWCLRRLADVQRTFANWDNVTFIKGECKVGPEEIPRL